MPKEENLAFLRYRDRLRHLCMVKRAVLTLAIETRAAAEAIGLPILAKQQALIRDSIRALRLGALPGIGKMVRNSPMVRGLWLSALSRAAWAMRLRG